MISKALCGNGHSFPDGIQEVFEDVLNDKKSGWVVLHLNNRRIVKAEHVETI